MLDDSGVGILLRTPTPHGRLEEAHGGLQVIGVVLPSRGLIFAEVMESLIENLQGYDYKIYQSIGLGIPHGHNNATERALADGCSHIWFVEDDTVAPPDALGRMLHAEGDIVAIDYGVNGWSCIARAKIDSEILWCGLGCTLVKRKVFEELERPYFRDDMQLRLNDWKWIPAPKNRYGGQDIWFCCKAREKGFKIQQIQGECKHLKLDSLAPPEQNIGGHVISEKPKIEKHQFL